MNPYYRPRRSMLYVPGCSTRYLHTARTLKVDSVILDLGDPILVEAKVESRRNVVDAVLSGGYGRREVVQYLIQLGQVARDKVMRRMR